MADYFLVAALGLIAVAAVAFPLITGPARYDDPAQLERDVQRYRAALSAGTVCTRCRFANPEASRFCGGCGRPLKPDPDTSSA